jgi:hypothetical protein
MAGIAQIRQAEPVIRYTIALLDHASSPKIAVALGDFLHIAVPNEWAA